MDKKLFKGSILAILMLIVGMSGCTKHVHTYETTWSNDETNHWHAATCEHTEEVSGLEAHTWNKGVVTTKATHTAEGVKTYTCTVCGATKTEAIDKIADHTYAEAWSSDETNHWHECECGVGTEKEAHTFGEAVIVGPTSEKEGTSTRECSVCGYQDVEVTCEKLACGTVEEPLTADELIALVKTLDEVQIAGSKFYVKGVITGKVYTSRYTENAYSVTLIDNDDTYAVMSYYAKWAKGVTAVELKAGDTIVVGGVLTVYQNTKLEFADNTKSYIYSVNTCEHPTDLVKVEAAPATCTTNGNIEHYTCPTCGRCYSDAEGQNELVNKSWVIPATGHTMTHVEAVAASCTTAGNSEYYTCAACEKYFSDAEGKNEIAKDSWVIEATGHALTKTDAVKVTCLTDGNTEYYTCSECEKYFSDAEGKNEIAKDSWVIPATGHTLTKTEANPATCTVDGNSEYYTCSGCEKYFSDAEGKNEIAKDSWVIPATGHSLTHVEAVPATLYEEGNVEYWYCASCKKYFSDEACTTEIAKVTTDKLTNKVSVKEGYGVNVTYVATNEENHCEAGFIANVNADASGDGFAIRIKNNTGTETPVIVEIMDKAGNRSLLNNGCQIATIDLNGNWAKQTWSTNNSWRANDKYVCIPANFDGWIYIAYDQFTARVGYGTGAANVASLYAVWFNINTQYDAYANYSVGAIAAKTNEGWNIVSDTTVSAVCKHFVNAGVAKANEWMQTGKVVITGLNDCSLTKHEATPATCTTTGNIEYYECNNCHWYFSDAEGKNGILLADTVAPIINHTLVHHEAVAAQCGVDGNVEYYECSECHAKFSDAEGTTPITDVVVPALTHNIVKVDEVLPTAEANGHEAYYKCENCETCYADEEGTIIVDPNDLVTTYKFAAVSKGWYGVSGTSNSIDDRTYGVTYLSGFGGACTSYPFTGAVAITNLKHNNTFTFVSGKSVTNYNATFADGVGTYTTNVINDGFGSTKLKAGDKIVFVQLYDQDKYGSTISWTFDAETGDFTANYTLSESHIAAKGSSTTITIYAYYIPATGSTEYQGIIDPVNGMMFVKKDSTIWMSGMSATEAIKANYSTSYLNANARVVGYTENEITRVTLIMNDNYYFGVTLKDVDGNPVTVANAGTASTLFIYNGEELITRLGYDGSTMVELDGFEGTYTNETLGELKLNGHGGATIGEQTGTYTVNEDGTFDVVLNNLHIVVTINQKTYTFTKPEVVVNFNNGGHGGDNTTVNANTKVAYNLPVLEEEGYEFLGWFAEETFETAVTEFVPTENVTLYAKWGQLLTFQVVGDKVENKNVTVAVGKKWSTVLETLDDVKVEGKKYAFVQYYTMVEGEKIVIDTDTVVTSDDAGLIINVEWAEIPSYAGTYAGGNTYAVGSYYAKSNKVVISNDGTVTYGSSTTGTVSEYDATTGVITWVSGTNTYKFLFSGDNVIMAMSGSGATATSAEPTNDIYTFVREDTYTLTTNLGIKWQNGAVASNFVCKLLDVTVKADSSTKTIVWYNGIIYENATITDASGNALTAATAKNAKTLIVVNGTETLFAIKANATWSSAPTTITTLDKYRGTFTAGFTDDSLVLFGDGTGTLNGAEVRYVEVEDGRLDVFKVESGKDTEYYLVDISFVTNTCMINPTKATLTYVSAYAQPDASEVYCKIAVALEDLEDTTTHFFKGWYTEETYENKVTSVTLTENKTVYAKWVEKVTVTIDYNGANIINTSVVVEKGTTLKVSDPTYEGHSFVGWTYGDGNEFVSNTTIVNEDITIVANWSTPFVQAGTYAYFNMYSDSTTAVKTSGSTLTISEGGVTTGISGTFASEYKDVTDGVIRFASDNRYFYYNAETGLIWTAYRTNTTGVGNDTYIGWDTSKVKSFAYGGIKAYSPNAGTSTDTYAAFIKLTMADDSTMLVAAFDGKIYPNVTWNADKEYNTVYKESVITVKQGDNVIAKITNKHIAYADSVIGSYTNDTETLILDGFGTATLNTEVGTYTINNDGTLDVVIGANNYKVTLTGTTYTAVSQKVTITFNTADKATVSPIEVAKNAEVELPTVDDTAEYFFRGWYTEETFENKCGSKFTTDVDATLYAKWVKKVTLTVVYGNEVDNDVQVIGEKDTIVYADKGLVNLKVVEGYYEDAEFTTAFTATSITEDKTIYANWKDAHALYGKWVGTEVWGSSTGINSQAGGTSSSYITFDAEGKSSGYNVNAIGVDGKSSTTTGYYVFADVTNNVFGKAYSTTPADSFGTDLYIYTKSEKTGVSSTGFYWNNGKSRIVELTIASTDKVIIFIDVDTIYGNVALVNADGEALTVAEAKTSEVFTINASTGTKIVTYGKVNNDFVVADGLQGTYAFGTKTVVLDGYGNATIGEDVVAYTYANEKVSFILNGQQIIGTLADATFTQVADGFEGTYVLADNPSIVLDGFGNATYNETNYVYVIDGTNLTLTGTEGNTVGFGIDVETKAYVTKSIFAGLTFTKSGNVTIAFDDVANISGTITTGSYPKYIYGFSGEFDSTANTLTLTITTQNYNMGNVGKTIILDVTNGNLKSNAETVNFGLDSSNTYSADYTTNAIDVDCATFTL